MDGAAGAVEPRLPGQKIAFYTLKLSISESQIIWSHRWGDIERNGEATLDLSARDQIDLMTELLHVLLDRAAAEQDGEYRKDVDGVLLRLTRHLGAHLHQVLFGNEDLRAALHAALKQTEPEDDSGGLVRIELNFLDRGRSHACWPWEYLCLPDTPQEPWAGKFLGMLARLALNRRVSNNSRSPLTGPPKLLLVVSRPTDEGPVDDAALLATLNSLKRDGKIILSTLVEPEPGAYLSRNIKPVATFSAFKYALGQGHDIVHFIGHGRVAFNQIERQIGGELGFVNADGRVHWVPEQELAEAFSQTNSVKLVFLQACESARATPRAHLSSVAMQLARKQIPAVIAMQAKIENAVANSFAAAFYGLLQHDVPIDWAVKEAREALSKFGDTQRLAFGLPVVYLSDYRGLSAPSPPSAQTPSNRRATEQPETVAIKPSLLDPSCPLCGFALDEKQRKKKRCPGCGLLMRCESCDLPFEQRDPRELYCGECGAQIDSPFARSAPVPATSLSAEVVSTDSTDPLAHALRDRYPVPQGS